MKNIANIFFLTLLILAGFFVSPKVQAQSEEVGLNSSEFIESFITQIKVNTDNSINVTENIVYNTGTEEEHHGIYRDIFTTSSQDRKMSFEDISVEDEFGNYYQYTTSKNGNTFQIKIGDPDTTFSGQKIYIIKYRVTRAVAQLKDVDEIYWNVTGNNWNMPIYEAWAIVTLPVATSGLQAACYFGEMGSTNQCEPEKNDDGVYLFSVYEGLNSYEGLTVAVGFSKGVVIPYTPADDFRDFLLKYLGWLIAILLPLLTLIFSLKYWYKNGRDPKGTGVIVAQYDVPENLTPMEVSGIVNENVSATHISAEIIYLATKGYLKINQLEEKTLGFFKTTDYELIKLKDFSDLPNDFDQKLLKGLFESSKGTVKLSDLRYKFSSTAESVITKSLNSLVGKKYYKNLGRIKSGPARLFTILFVAIWASGFFGIITGVVFFPDNPLPIILGIFVSVITYGIVSHFNPAKTVEGVRLKEYLLGLKDYLCIAEKDRLEFHNAPEKKPEIFEKLLPYAMVLEVSDIWAKEFEDIYTTPPNWYSGSSSAAFSAVDFSHNLSSFSSFASSSLSATHSSGGSGGGGSSGGGGGGGGGGSW